MPGGSAFPGVGTCRSREAAIAAQSVPVEGELPPRHLLHCSHCRRKGLLLSFAPRSKFTLDSGAESLDAYLFNKHKIEHQLLAAPAAPSRSPMASAPGSETQRDQSAPRAVRRSGRAGAAPIRRRQALTPQPSRRPTPIDGPRLVRLVRHHRIRSTIRSIEGAGPVVARPADPAERRLRRGPRWSACSS